MPSLRHTGAMDNLHLFELLNAPPGLQGAALLLPLAVAQWAIYLVPAVMVGLWMRADGEARLDLLFLLLTVGIALLIAQAITHVWPQPRPFMLHLGTQYLAHSPDPGFPSDHVTVLWSLGLGALCSRRYALYGFPLLALGLAVGWSRVFLGVHFPLDVLGALPVAVAAAILVTFARTLLTPVLQRALRAYQRLEDRVWRRRAENHSERAS